MPSAAVAAPSGTGRVPRDDAAPQILRRPDSKDLNDEARFLLEVRRELGPEYEEELVGVLRRQSRGVDEEPQSRADTGPERG